MANVTDMDLMRSYAEGNSEAAFAELVQRHINFVYSAALRQVGNPQDAQDVTQAVFIILARKISGLRHRATLTGWLYETTRFAARQLLRTKARRQAREQEAYMDSIVQPDNDTVWKQLAPILEDAMARLNEKDRALLALRFFENKSVAETASLLGLNEWAVRKRAERSVEKLRVFFHKRGVVVPASVLTTAISSNSVHAAPSGLAVTISTAALAKGAAASTSTLTLVKGALKLMFWSKTKIAISTAVGLILIAGITTVSVEKVRGHDTDPAATPDISKAITGPMLLISAQFIEMPDSLLDGQNLNWQPGDSGSSSAIISAVEQTNLLRALRRNRNATVIGAPRIAFSPAPGKTLYGSVAMAQPIKNSPTKQQIGTRLNVYATLASDSQSVDLKSVTKWQRLANGATMDYGTPDNLSNNDLTASATLSLHPDQTMVIRAPLQGGSLLGDTMAAGTEPRSVLIIVTPTIQNLKMRFVQKVVKTKTFRANSTGSLDFTYTNSSTSAP